MSMSNVHSIHEARSRRQHHDDSGSPPREITAEASGEPCEPVITITWALEDGDVISDSLLAAQNQARMAYMLLTGEQPGRLRATTKLRTVTA